VTILQNAIVNSYLALTQHVAGLSIWYHAEELAVQLHDHSIII